MNSIRLVHIFEQFYHLGGVHSRLRKHLEGDRQHGIDPRFIITWEKQSRPQGEPQLYFLGMKNRDTVALMRHRFKLATQYTQPQVSVYHTFDNRLFDLDPAPRRLFFLNNQWDGIQDFLRIQLQWADGVLTPSQPLCQMVRDCWNPEHGRRVAFIPQPILPPTGLPPHPPLKGRPMRIGVCGRLIKRQKQVELLPPLFRHLEARQFSFEVEFLGDGMARSWLESELPDRRRYIFHGQKEGKDYWSILNQFDVLISTTKFEAGPITVLEAMSTGVIPVFPDIPCQGQVYIKQLNFPLLFTNGEWDQVSTILENLRRRPPVELTALREACRALMVPHQGETYLREFSAAVKSMIAQPRISSLEKAPQPWGYERLTFSQLGKINKLTTHFSSLLRRIWPQRTVPGTY